MLSSSSSASVSINTPRFASYAISDVGASNREQGHIRTLLYTEDDQLLGQVDQHISDKPFESEDDFTRGYAKSVADLLNQHADTIKNDPLRQIRGMVPGSAVYTSGQPVITEIGNMVKTNGQTLKHVQMSDIVRHLKDRVPSGLLKDDGKTMELEFSNDMVGAAASAIHSLYAEPDKYGMQDGDQVTLMMVGGGFGVVHMRHFADTENKNGKGQVEIVAAEDGNVVQKAHEASLEQSAASVRAFVSRFKQGLTLQGIALTDAQENALRGNGKAVTVLEEAQKIIPGLTAEQHQQAAMEAIDPLLDALATVINQNVLRYHQKFVLTGPVISGVNAFLESQKADVPELRAELDKLAEASKEDARLAELKDAQDGSVLADMLLSRLWQGHWHENKLREFVLGNHHSAPFKLITQLPMTSNAEGGPVLKNAKRAGSGNNPNRLMLSLNA